MRRSVVIMRPAAAIAFLAFLTRTTATLDFILKTLNNEIDNAIQNTRSNHTSLPNLSLLNFQNLLSSKEIESIRVSGSKEIDLLIKSMRRSARDAGEKRFEESQNVTERISKHGYMAQEYTVTTEDGYLLGMQRIRASGVRGRRVPVLLMHGLLQSASVWIDGGPGYALAYLLARAGHDVWLGNVRGNYYSRRHLTLDPDSDPDFWQFSADEIARYDLPPLIDKVLFETGTEKLNYIGFSQGGGTFLMMCCEVPQYCGKVRGAIAIAPSGRHLLTKSFLFRHLTDFCRRNEKALHESGIHEVLPKNGILQQLFSFICRYSELGRQLCEAGINLMDNHRLGSFTEESITNMASNFPSGTSVQNLAHYGQALRSRSCRKYDYGPLRNREVYGVRRAPRYNLRAVTVPVKVIYGLNDGIVDAGDVRWLVRALPRAEAVAVQDPRWNHLDVVYSRDVPTMLYPVVESFLMKYENSAQ